MSRGFVLCLILGLAFACHPVGAQQGGARSQEDVPARRSRILALDAAAPSAAAALAAALQDESPFVRRAAIRKIVSAPNPDPAVLKQALSNGDALVRRAALLALAGKPKADGLPLLEKAFDDSDVLVRAAAVKLAALIEPRDERTLAFLRRVQRQEKDGQVKEIATRALPTAFVPFDQIYNKDTEAALLKNRPEMADHVERIYVAKRIPLPKAGWRFQKDWGAAGHRDNWFDPAFDDSAWEQIEIERPWEGGYEGIGWYRLQIDLPPKPELAAVELAFEAVDENAWVWVNGVYAGQQNLGLKGWNRPFRLDVTEAVRWGQKNSFVVRVNNTRGAGGIWKPVTLEALALK